MLGRSVRVVDLCSVSLQGTFTYVMLVYPGVDIDQCQIGQSGTLVGLSGTYV